MRRLSDFLEGTMVRVVDKETDEVIEGEITMVFWKKNNRNTIDPYLQVKVTKMKSKFSISTGHNISVPLNKEFFDYPERLTVI